MGREKLKEEKHNSAKIQLIPFMKTKKIISKSCNLCTWLIYSTGKENLSLSVCVWGCE